MEQKAVDAPEKMGGGMMVVMMMMLDTFKRHLTSEIKATGSSIITDLVVVPKVMASQLKLLHDVVNKLCKDHRKQLYVVCFDSSWKV
jgi:hypothetical protein